MSSIPEYFAKVVKEFDTSVPKNNVLNDMSVTLDSKMNQVIDKFFGNLETSADHASRVEFLEKSDRCSGKFEASKIIFTGVNPYEQMYAVDSWLKAHKIAKTHTFFMSSMTIDYIPVTVKKMDGIDATAMHVILGSTRGEKAAPKYEDWATTDPIELQQEFMKPLLALEVVRQPNYAFATILKDEAYRNEIIDNTWRYGSEYACVEDRGQSKNSKKKLRSAALNLCSLLDKKSTIEDPLADDVIITKDVLFSDFSDEKGHEDLDVVVTVGELFRATRKAFVRRDESALGECLENLFISSLGPVTTESLKKLVAETLIENDKSSTA